MTKLGSIKSPIYDDIAWDKFVRSHNRAWHEHGHLAVSFSCTGAGHEVKGRGCEDYSDFYIGSRYSCFALADGHSSARESRFGSRLAVSVLLDLIKSFDDTDEDIILEKFEDKSLFESFFNNWFSQIIKCENLSIAEMDIMTKRSVASHYGTTLSFFVVGPSKIISGILADRGSIIKRIGKESEFIFEDDGIGDKVSESVCDMDPKQFQISVFDKAEIEALAIMTDGLYKSFLPETTSIVDNLTYNAKNSKVKEAFFEDIENFMLKSRVEINDDISLVYAALC